MHKHLVPCYYKTEFTTVRRQSFDLGVLSHSLPASVLDGRDPVPPPFIKDAFGRDCSTFRAM